MFSSADSNDLTGTDGFEDVEQPRNMHLQILKPVPAAKDDHGDSQVREVLLKFDAPVRRDEHGEVSIDCGAKKYAVAEAEPALFPNGGNFQTGELSSKPSRE